MEIQQETIPKTEDFVLSPAIEKRRFSMLMIAGIALPIILYPYLSSTLLFAVTDPSWHVFLSRVVLWIVLGCLYLYARKGEMQNMLLWSENHYKPLFYLKWMLFLYLLNVVVASISRIPFWLGFHENNVVIIKLLAIMQKSPVLIVFCALTAGITEEFIFRGYILSRLSLLFSNKHTTVVISAVLFAVVHLGYHTFHELIFTFGIGIVFAYHYQKYRNLTILMAVHFLIDLVATGILKHL